MTFASLRRTEDGGATWRNADIALATRRMSPLFSCRSARSARGSSSCRCGIARASPANRPAASVGEGCERGYVSYDSGDTWQTQTLPVRGILDLNQPLALQTNRMIASNDCTEVSCIHLLISADGGQTWQVSG